MENIRDYLTGIYNEAYLKKNYQIYLSNHSNVQFIMIDFQKFKSINDIYGHNVGDQCLIVFASIIDRVFDDSLVVRLHGDEFAILTKYSIDEIKSRFELCDKIIELSVVEGKIPIAFGFNAGSTMAEHGIRNTKEKADYMMYYAKNNQKKYQPFQEDIWKTKKEEELFLTQIDTSLKDDSLQYAIRNLFHFGEKSIEVHQIYTRDLNGSSIFMGNHYELLRKSNRIRTLDIHNIQYLIEHLDPIAHPIIINVDYLTILTSEQLYDYLRLLLPFSKINSNNIIFSINLQGISFSDYSDLIHRINLLKELGILIRLDHFDSRLGDEIWENSSIDYIKFDHCYWRKAMHSDKIDYYLKKKVDIMMEYKDKTVIMFDFIENEEQNQYISTFGNKDILVSGNYYSGEKKLQLKRD